MKDYLKEVSRETSLLFKVHPYKYTFLYILAVGLGFWLANATPNDGIFQILPFFPVVAIILWILVAMIVGDIDIRKMRKSGIISALVAALLCQSNVSASYTQVVESQIIGENALEFYPTHVMIPLTSDFQPPEAVVGYVVGGAILIGGVWVVLKIIDFCERKLPVDPEEKKKDQFHSVGSVDGDSYAASATFGSFGSCRMPEDLRLRAASGEHIPFNVFEMQAEVVNANGVPDFRLTSQRMIREVVPGDNVEDYTVFKNRLLNQYGVPLDERYTGIVHYGKNGVTASAEEVPISFDFETKTFTVSNGNPTYSVVIERSVDMVSWTPMAKISISEGYKFKLADASQEDKAFYRIMPL